MKRSIVPTAFLLAATLVGACGDPRSGGSATNLVDPAGGGSDGATTAGEITPDQTPDGAAPALPDLGGTGPTAAMIAVGGSARTTGDLNLRGGAGTGNPILTIMPCGSLVDVVGGPQLGWWNVRYMGTSGWASGKYLVADAAFVQGSCAAGHGDAGATDGAAGMGGMAGDGGMNAGSEVADIFARAKLAVGYSYDWGHGSWRADGAQVGSCMGSCPNCTHSGSYGADCSGFVAKCWQVPATSPLTTDLHPYATFNFYNEKTHWAPVARTQIHPADALVYNANGAGHIMLFESGADPWGNLWVYEARGCATGVVHDLHAVSASYITIRREGL